MISGQQLQGWRERALRVEEEVCRAVIGQHDTMRLINVALFERGHVLLEGDVGVGKTTLLRPFARAVDGDFERCPTLFEDPQSLGHSEGYACIKGGRPKMTNGINWP